MAPAFGMDVVPTRVEALRSKAKRLVARGWLAEQQPGRSRDHGQRAGRGRWPTISRERGREQRVIEDLSQIVAQP
ncbi:hypothetical protein ABZY09_47555 [Streptomyces sp. NPDC002928]|uniref:hypothetical protein n=1 Tax=Streptomyces sp. NPDC002928 TaxID=3154440 RepID=UPI00339EA804